MKDDIYLAQPVLERIFPRYTEYPMNSVTPAISYSRNGILLSMLILADDVMARDFKADDKDEVGIEITCYTRENQDGIGEDLVIRFVFQFSTGHPMFEAVIAGDLLDHQKDFVRALKQVDELILWIVDSSYKVFRVLELSWNYEGHKEVLEPLLA
ncbi:MAG: hypothetical protein GXZ01_05410 [Clostridiaceae bacterium]|nr:hypothetical protein [Clostridiaceae bacterium]